MLSDNLKQLNRPKLLRVQTISALRNSQHVKEEELFFSLNERLAQQIVQSGFECNAIIDIGSLVIEKQPFYSSLFAMSPTIVTNRGCIRLEGNGRRNIDFIQIIQKN